VAPHDGAALAQQLEPERHGRALRSDQSADRLVGQTDGEDDAVRRDAAEAFGEMPEQHEDPDLDPRLLGDHQVDDQAVVLLLDLVHEGADQAGPAADGDQEPVVEDGERRRQRCPPGLRRRQPAAVVRERAEDVAGPVEAHARVAADVDVARQEPRDDDRAERAAAAHRRGDLVAAPGRELDGRRHHAAAREARVGGRQVLGELRQLVEQPDGRLRAGEGRKTGPCDGHRPKSHDSLLTCHGEFCSFLVDGECAMRTGSAHLVPGRS
jgi:hypothetical protein